jgi:hypothetical protein
MTGSDEQCSRTPDASLYVLGELRGRQQESFARHLRRCEECADEVDLLQQVADAMPLLSSQQVSAPEEEPRTQQRVPTLAVAASNARVAASNARAAASNAKAAASNTRAVARAGRTELRAVAVRPVLRPIVGGGGAAPARSGGRRRLLKTPIPKPALIGLVAVAVLAIATVALSQRAASTRYVRIQAGWPQGGAALKLQGNDLQLLVEGMPKPATGAGYQVWVLDKLDQKFTPTRAWLHLNRAGEAGVAVPGDYHNWLAVMVYTEPLHGRDTTASGASVVGDLHHVK